MTAPYCEICGESVPMDLDHVGIAAEYVHTDDRNAQDDYLVHIECWNHHTVEWIDPA